MIAALTRYTTRAVIVAFQGMVAGYTSELGNPMPVAVRRAFGPTPAAEDLPEVAVQSLPEEELATTYLGDAMGVDAHGVAWYGLGQESIRCPVQLRARTAVERDNLFDFLVSGLMLPLVVGGVAWKQRLYQESGLLVHTARGTGFAERTVSGLGVVYEAATTLLLEGQLAASFGTVVTQGVTIQPVLTLDLVV